MQLSRTVLGMHEPSPQRQWKGAGQSVGCVCFCGTVMGAIPIVTVAQQLCTHFTASIFQGQSNWDGTAGH